jgi:hypothetical protein
MKQTIRNWSDYNSGLRQWGSLTFWVEDTFTRIRAFLSTLKKQGLNLLDSFLPLLTRTASWLCLWVGKVQKG